MYQCKQTLVVVIDACFSGIWAVEANRRHLSDVVVQTACAPTELAKDPMFTPAWVRLNFQEMKIDNFER
jgi:hypothetical protein